MVMSAQQDAVLHVGRTAVTIPMSNMVRLRPAGRSVAAGPAASTVSHCQRDALPRGEQPLVTSDIEGLAVGERYVDCRTGANEPLDCLDRDGIGLPLDETVAARADRFDSAD
jgi:hypothetical protein